MTKNLKNIILIFLMIFSSCIREEIISSDALSIYEEKPVVYCFLTEGDSISAWIAHTLPVYDQLIQPEDTYVLDAKVFIKNEDNEQVELFLIDSLFPIYSCSQENFKIEKGKEYFMEVELANNLRLFAETYVPELEDTLKSIIAEEKIYPENSDQFYIPILLNWENNSNLKNMLFYEASIYCKNCLPPKKYSSYGSIDLWDIKVNENSNSIYYEIWYDENYDFINDFINDYKYFHLYTINTDISNFTSSYDLFENVNDNIGSNHFLVLFRGVISE